MKELRTERLYLRYITEADTQRIFDCWASDPEVARYVTWIEHKNVDTTKAYVGYILEEYKKPDCYRWGIELSETGELIGIIDVVGYHEGAPVIGYCSGKAYWNHGYMTEALKAVCAQLLDDGYDTLLIQAADPNFASNRVIQKAGFELASSRVAPMSELKPDMLVKINSYLLKKSK
ncbi:MAG: GNAT family N-acetyltransferase [Ruminococcus sp.]|nr:GNAT family N-acetyltransferase [Ruminococcus sp.]